MLLGKAPHVPSAYQGTTQITVTNAWERPLCAFSLDAGAVRNTENWLGDGHNLQAIAPGASRTFAVKPGTYHVLGGFCDGSQLVAAVGNYGAATTTIQGTSLIAMGPKHVDAVAGAQTLAFPKLYYPQAASSGGAEEPAAEEPAANEAPSSSSSSSSSASASSAEAAPAGPQCLQHGAVCSEGQTCCAGMKCASRTKFSDGSLGNGYCE